MNKVKCLITDIEKRVDKNQHNYWLVRTQWDEKVVRNYLAFSTDYNLSPRTRSLLENYPHQIVNKWAVLTIQKQEGDNLEKVIDVEMEK